MARQPKPEELNTELESSYDDRIGSALLKLLRPPDDLHERMSARLAERLQRRADLDLLGSLLGVPKEAGELFFLSTELTEQRPPKSGASGEIRGLTSPPEDLG